MLHVLLTIDVLFKWKIISFEMISSGDEGKVNYKINYNKGLQDIHFLGGRSISMKIRFNSATSTIFMVICLKRLKMKT